MPDLLPMPDDRVIADAARMRLLVRVLPMQRHDVLGHLSVARMAVLTARKRAERGVPLASDDWLPRIDDQLAEATMALRQLRWWDRSGGLAASAQAVLDEALLTLQPLLAMRSQTARIDAAHTPPDEEGSAWPAPEAQLALLAAALHVADGEGGGCDWRLQRHTGGVWALCTPGDGPAVGGAGMEGGRVDPAYALPRWVADALAAAAGAQLQVDACDWRLAWPAAPRA